MSESEERKQAAEALVALGSIQTELRDMDSGVKDYIDSGKTNHLLSYRAAEQKTLDELGALERLLAGDPAQLRRLAALKELIPGAAQWPLFVRNRSEQFEARLVMVEIPESASILLRGMAGSRLPIVTAHGEGRAEFSSSPSLVCMRYVNNRGDPTEVYPYNPSGSPQGICGLTTPDGRFTVVMPHPERVFRTVQWSWAPSGLGEDSPWMRLFRNARRWVG